MNTLPSWKKLKNPDLKTITSPVGVPRRPGFRALDSTCMIFSMFIKKHLTFYLQTRLNISWHWDFKSLQKPYIMCFVK